MDLFSQFGPIVMNKIDFDHLGRSKGTATIEYKKPQSASKAREEYNGATLDGRPLIIEFEKFDRNNRNYDNDRDVPGIRRKVIRKEPRNYGYNNRGRDNERRFRGGQRRRGGNYRNFRGKRRNDETPK